MSSPGVSVSYELPNFASIQTAPLGIPPGVIGTSQEGPAFIPITVGSITDFEAKFGIVSGSHFGTLAVKEWLKYQGSATYMRVLGIGNGKRRLSTGATDAAGENVPAGGVKQAGFIVGSQQVNPNGMLGNNPYANTGGPAGRTYFLGAFMSESAGSTWFSSAGIQTGSVCAPIIRGVLMAPSGVILSLSGCYTGNASTASAGVAAGSFVGNLDGGATVGSIDLAASAYNFVLLLNGHKGTTKWPSAITASLNPAGGIGAVGTYITASFNQDPTKIQQAGHLLYASYDMTTAQAVITGSGIVTAGSEKTARGEEYLQDSVFLVTSSMARNPTDVVAPAIPNFENFSDRYAAAFSPTVISQKINRKPQDLFTFHVLDDGAIGNEQLKITISNQEPSSIEGGYGTFDVSVRKFWDNDLERKLLGGETYLGCNLDPASDNYIARRIGDRHTYFDFDRASWAQRMVVAGSYKNLSAYIRVEMNVQVERTNISNKLLPVGFRGPYHLVTSGSSIMSLPQHPLTDGSVIDAATEWSQRLVEPPIPYRQNLSTGTGDGKASNSSYCWGFKTEQVTKTTEPNVSNDPNRSAQSFCKYFPKFSTTRKAMFVGNNAEMADAEGTIYDSDRFNNNMFTLENIQIHTKSDADVVKTDEWAFANYRRNGILVRQLKSNNTYDTGRFLNVAKDFSETGVKDFLSFTMPVQAGFNGQNIFESEKIGMTNAAAVWELDDPRQGGRLGPTISAFKHALRLISEKTETDIQLLAIPGIRVPYITNTALEVVEEHFSAMYVMDLEEYDTSNNVVTSSAQTVSVENTADAFRSRALDSSFTAAYFPDVSVYGDRNIQVYVPPSVMVLGAIGNNDKVGSKWTAPTGYIRGVLNDAVQLKVKYLSGSATAVETLYNVGINPIISDTGGIVIYGQKTLMAGGLDSAVERVNVRRLLIEIRRKVRAIAKFFVFEQNREETLSKFQKTVETMMSNIQLGAGVERYRVQIDTTTTTQADIESNIVRGKIFLQPMRSEEFISIDFDTE